MHRPLSDETTTGSTPESSAAGTRASAGAVKLLVVDDDASTRMMARAFLEREGFLVHEASDGAEALDGLDTVRPDLILLDVDMPVLDGFATCERLRERTAYRHVPVLMLTGLDNDEAIRRAYEVGATDFASKPIKWSLLAHRLRYMLRASEGARELEKSRSGLAAAQRIARLGDWELDPSTGRMRWSDELYRILGRDPADVEPTLDSFLALIHESDRARFEAALEEVGNGSGRASLDVALRIDASTERHARQDIVLQARSGTDDLRLRGVLQDFSERRRAERRIQQLAFFDTLTGLPNRERFNDTLARTAREDLSSDGGLAVLSLGLDDFKRINDTLGHAAGDTLLIEVGRRLSDLAHSYAAEGNRTMAARMGGDEFTLMLTGPVNADTLFSLARELIDMLHEPIAVRGQTVAMTPSVGIAMQDGETTSPESLLRNADLAMHAAKKAGTGSILLHDESMDAASQRRFAIDAELRLALERRELTINYQPQLDLADGSVYACEALLRWTSGKLGPVYPDEFIPLAEQNGTILEIGAWVMEQACLDALSWSEQELPMTTVAVNVSVLQFMQPGFADQVRETLERTGLDPARLELEITESLLAADTGSAIATLTALKSIGVTLSIDDFGTGYSSLGQLKHFPIDRVKIDRSFISDLHTDPRDAAITNAIIAMAGSLGLRVLAEGVETEEHRDRLIVAGCNEIQGYWLGRPLPAAALIDDLARIGGLLDGLVWAESDLPHPFAKVG